MPRRPRIRSFSKYLRRLRPLKRRSPVRLRLDRGQSRRQSAFPWLSLCGRMKQSESHSVWQAPVPRRKRSSRHKSRPLRARLPCRHLLPPLPVSFPPRHEEAERKTEPAWSLGKPISRAVDSTPPKVKVHHSVLRGLLWRLYVVEAKLSRTQEPKDSSSQNQGWRTICRFEGRESGLEMSRTKGQEDGGRWRTRKGGAGKAGEGR